MNSVQKRTFDEILKNEDLYLNMAGAKRRTLVDEYARLKSASRKYTSGLLNEALSREGYRRALKAHKVDPYLAGGAAQGLAGAGAGVLTALNADKKNKEIDALRNQYRDEVSDVEYENSINKKKFFEELDKMDSLLNSIGTIRNYRENKKEEDYQKAENLMKGDAAQTEEALNIFNSLGDYKDSVEMAKKALELHRIAQKKEGTVFAIKFLLGAICLFILLGYMFGEVCNNRAQGYAYAAFVYLIIAMIGFLEMRKL